MRNSIPELVVSSGEDAPRCHLPPLSDAVGWRALRRASRRSLPRLRPRRACKISGERHGRPRLRGGARVRHRRDAARARASRTRAVVPSSSVPRTRPASERVASTGRPPARSRRARCPRVVSSRSPRRTLTTAPVTPKVRARASRDVDIPLVPNDDGAHRRLLLRNFRR